MERVTKAKVLGAQDGKAGWLMTCGVRFMAWAEEPGGGFSLIEHPISPRTLAAPLHRHSREDEYSFVLEGEVGIQIGDEIIYGGPGELVAKPRGIAHAFWNRTDEPARALEIIAPGGFEPYFDDMATLLARPDFNPGMLAELGARYGLESRPESVPQLCAEHGLDHPMLHMRDAAG